jgi:hypothetical protein
VAVSKIRSVQRKLVSKRATKAVRRFRRARCVTAGCRRRVAKQLKRLRKIRRRMRRCRSQRCRRRLVRSMHRRRSCHARAARTWRRRGGRRQLRSACQKLRADLRRCVTRHCVRQVNRAIRRSCYGARRVGSCVRHAIGSKKHWRCVQVRLQQERNLCDTDAACVAQADLKIQQIGASYEQFQSQQAMTRDAMAANPSLAASLADGTTVFPSVVRSATAAFTGAAVAVVAGLCTMLLLL